MATMNEVIEYVDGVKPNVYSDEDKAGWISRIDTTFRIDMKGEDKHTRYVFPEDADKELFAVFPYDDLYSLYVMAMIDFHNKDYSGYNNTAMMFAERLDAYKKHYIQYKSYCKAKNFRNVMG